MPPTRLTLASSLLWLGNATAQCTPSWSTQPSGIADGPGPAPGRLVIAGSFTNVVDARAPRFAAQD
ncbi:MAG: hypothetical protein JNK15_25520 [Planctomycetes bacterium]|nr:hypothetical protein [Planctomycetota bacterium]